MAQTVRYGETEDVVFTLERNDVAFALTSATSVTLRRRSSLGVDDSTDNLTGLLSVTDAAAGEVTLTPSTTFWAIKGYYDCYIDVLLAGKVYSFDADEDKNPERFTVVPKYS